MRTSKEFSLARNLKDKKLFIPDIPELPESDQCKETEPLHEGHSFRATSLIALSRIVHIHSKSPLSEARICNKGTVPKVSVIARFYCNYNQGTTHAPSCFIILLILTDSLISGLKKRKRKQHKK